MAAAATSSFAVLPSARKSRALTVSPRSFNSVLFAYKTQRCGRNLRIACSATVSSDPQLRTGEADQLVASILSKAIAFVCLSSSGSIGAERYNKPGVVKNQVKDTDGGVSLKREEHQQVAEIAQHLQNYCVSEPVNSPLIFGEWDVAYCSNPTSPGGGYRSAIGRLFFKTKEMVQAVEAPNTIRNKIKFSLLGFLQGEVSLKGKLKALDSNWIKVIFEAPQLKVGGLDLQYGGESEVKLQITYVDEKIRLGKGSRGSLFVFQKIV
ncbi:Probable plastid-lipid-associated protein 8, chloroplastic [Linum perenne]